MSIRTKTLAVMALLLALTFGALGAVLVRQIAAGFGRVEGVDARRNVERVEAGLDASIDPICSQVTDWANWDDAYAFAADRNQPFVESNIAEPAFKGLPLNLIAFFRPDGTLLYAKAYDAEKGMGAELPLAFMKERLGQGSPLLAPPGLEGQRRGILVGEGHPPLLYCSQPVLTSAGEGPARGTLLMAAWLTEARRQSLAQRTRLSFTVSPALADPARAAAAGRALGGDGIQLVEVGEDRLAGFLAVPEANGPGALLVEVSLPREVNREAVRTVWAVLAALGLVGLLFAGATLALLEMLVLRRVATMSRDVRSITDGFEFRRRVEEGGGDEVSVLGRSVNGLLSAMEQAISVADDGSKP
jgi:sensor domain CHASE-containing protein